MRFPLKTGLDLRQKVVGQLSHLAHWPRVWSEQVSAGPAVGLVPMTASPTRATVMIVELPTQTPPMATVAVSDPMTPVAQRALPAPSRRASPPSDDDLRQGKYRRTSIPTSPTRLRPGSYRPLDADGATLCAKEYTLARQTAPATTEAPR